MARKNFGPGDKWPQLDDKDCNEQAQRARSLGWNARTKESHGGFVIRCPAGECEVRFDSSPRNPTAKAKQARGIIQFCEHAEEHTDAVAAANEALDRAEMLIGAAEKQSASHSLFNAALIEERKALLDRAVELEQEALQILHSIDRVDADGGELGNFSGVVRGAKSYLVRARSKLTPLRRQMPVRSDVEAAWQRYKSVRTRLNRLARGWS